jgi:hypothetical protein
MSLSPFVSFQSRFVTYLLNFPRMSFGNARFFSPECLSYFTGGTAKVSDVFPFDALRGHIVGVQILRILNLCFRGGGAPAGLLLGMDPGTY